MVIPPDPVTELWHGDGPFLTLRGTHPFEKGQKIVIQKLIYEVTSVQWCIDDFDDPMMRRLRLCVNLRRLK